jgi:hypothetical protein
MSVFEIRVFEKNSKKIDRTLGSRSGSTPPAADRRIQSALGAGSVRARYFNLHGDHPPTPLNSDVVDHVGDTI